MASTTTVTASGGGGGDKPIDRVGKSGFKAFGMLLVKGWKKKG